MPQSDPQERADLETDPRFKTGRYRGFYVQWGARSGQDMFLSFAGERVSGWGEDPVGRFDVSGRYDTSSGRASISKRYPGRHTVDYDVTAEVKNGLWGLWRIREEPSTRGGFQLWPVGGLEEGVADVVEADRPVDVLETVGAGA